MLDDHAIAFVDFDGNRQYTTQGNVAENARAFLFLIDDAGLSRVKLWGRARIVEGDDASMQRLMPAGHRARAEQVVLFSVEARDRNCSKHIPHRIDAAMVARELKTRDERIAALEAQLARRHQETGSNPGSATGASSPTT